MRKETETELDTTPEVRKFSAGDSFFERVQEINDLIARRAYELFASRESTHGHHHEDWLRAETEILCTTPLDVRETETELTVLAELPGFSEKEIELRVEPRRLFITGKREEVSEQTKGKTVYSERRPTQIFRVLDLPASIDPNEVKATLSNGLLEITLSKVAIGKKIPVLVKAASA